MRLWYCATLLAAHAAVSPISCAAPLIPTKTWTNPEAAAKERPEFRLQGEYRGGDEGLQVADMGDGKFLVTSYEGGLPGAGWNGSAPGCEALSEAELRTRLMDRERVERESPTLGLQAPEGALVVFAGEPTDHVRGKIEDGLLWAGSQTTTPVGDFRAHVEFRLPYKPGRLPSSQDRGNSGVYIFGNYECQVLDSFALPLNRERIPFPAKSDPKQWCGSFYKFKLPDVPMCFPPLRWQTYDIEFTAPRFENGTKVKAARVTVRHNGVLIHDDVELPAGTGAGAKRPEKEKGILQFQGHGNPVAYRNIWIQPR